MPEGDPLTNRDQGLPTPGARYPDAADIRYSTYLHAALEELNAHTLFRDAAANRTEYDPLPGSLFVASDTGAIYEPTADGTSWTLAEFEVAALRAATAEVATIEPHEHDVTLASTGADGTPRDRLHLEGEADQLRTNWYDVGSRTFYAADGQTFETTYRTGGSNNIVRFDYRDQDGNGLFRKYISGSTARWLDLSTGHVLTNIPIGSNRIEQRVPVQHEEGTVYPQRGQPTTSELETDERMTYVSDGSDAHAAGDLVTARNASGSITTQVIAFAADDGAGDGGGGGGGTTDTVENWEWGGPLSAKYTEMTPGAFDGASISSGGAHSGSYGLSLATSQTYTISSMPGDSDDRYPAPGDTFDVWVRHDSTSTTPGIGRIHYGLQSRDNNDNIYRLQMSPQATNQLNFNKRTGGGSVDNLLSFPNVSFPAGTWRRIRVAWGANGTHNISVYSAGGTLLENQSVVDTDHGPGGIAYWSNLNSSWSFDDWEVA